MISRRAARITGRVGATVARCAGIGAAIASVHGMVGYAIAGGLRGSSAWFDDTVIVGVGAGLLGGVAAVVMAPAVVPLVWNRNVRQVVRSIVIGGAVGCGLGLVTLWAASALDESGTIAWVASWCAVALGFLAGAAHARLRAGVTWTAFPSHCCHKCGYNRRGVFYERVCPECGAKRAPRWGTGVGWSALR